MDRKTKYYRLLKSNFLPIGVSALVLFSLTMISHVPIDIIGSGAFSEVTNNPFEILLGYLMNHTILFIILVFITCLSYRLTKKVLGTKSSGKDLRGISLSKEVSQGQDSLMSEDEKEKTFDKVGIYNPRGLIMGIDKTEDHMLLTIPWAKKDRVFSPTNNNVLLAGESGTGKTSNFLLPNIYSAMDMGYTIVTTDPKGEIYQKSIAYAKHKGYENISLINLQTGSLLYSDGFDILKCVREAEDPQQETERLVDVILKNVRSGEDSFWEEANSNLLSLLILAVSVGDNYIPETSMDNAAKGRTMTEVINLLNSPDMESRVGDIIKGNVYNKKLLGAYYAAYIKNSQKDQIKVGLQGALGLFRTEAVTRILSEDEIDFKKIAREKSLVYVVNDPADSTYQVVLALFFSQLFKESTAIANTSPVQHLPVPMYIFFEEFSKVGYIPNFGGIVSVIRSLWINVIMCYQNITQLKETYSTKEKKYEWNDISSNCAIHILKGAHDIETAKFFSDLSGDMTIKTKATSEEVPKYLPKALRFNPSHRLTEREEGRKVLLVSEILKIRPDEILVMISKHNPIILDTYFNEWHPAWQYKTVDDDGREKKVIPKEHIPAWKRRDNLREQQNFQGSFFREQRSRDEIKVGFFEGVNRKAPFEDFSDEHLLKKIYRKSCDVLFENPDEEIKKSATANINEIYSSKKDMKSRNVSSEENAVYVEEIQNVFSSEIQNDDFCSEIRNKSVDEMFIEGLF